MAEATLAIRDGEFVQFFDDDAPPKLNAGERVYGVALVKPPAFLGKHHHPKSNPFMVACIAEYATRVQPITAWGWIHLTPDTRQDIGDALVKSHAQVGRWYWLVIAPPGEVASVDNVLTTDLRPGQNAQPALDWDAAQKHLEMIVRVYGDALKGGMPNLGFAIGIIAGVKKRFDEGERTPGLHEDIMGLEE